MFGGFFARRALDAFDFGLAFARFGVNREFDFRHSFLSQKLARLVNI